MSPLARSIVRASGASLDLRSVPGSGPQGRVLAADVLKALGTSSAAPAAAPNYEDVSVTPMRKVISTRLTESKQTIPHYYVNQNCCVDELLKVGSPPFDDG